MCVVLFQVEQERDELQKNQMEILLDLQQRSSLNSLLVDKKLEALTEVTENEGAQLYDVLSTSIDQMALSGTTNKPQVVMCPVCPLVYFSKVTNLTRKSLRKIFFLHQNDW